MGGSVLVPVEGLIELLFRKLLVEHVVPALWLHQHHVLILHVVARSLSYYLSGLLSALLANDLEVVARSHVVKLLPHYLLKTRVLRVSFIALWVASV